MHLFWLVLLVPAVLVSQWIWPVLKHRFIWSLGILLVGTVTVLWLAMGLPTLGSQRTVEAVSTMIAFRLVDSTDLPLIQILIACSVGWLLSTRVFVARRVPKAEVTMEEAIPST